MIPARGGSERLPRKNIKVLCGHPLIAYTIKAAQRANLLTDYLVSSEDAEILDVARAYGAHTPFVRPSYLAGNSVRNIDVVLHALQFMQDKRGYTYDIVLLLQPTCPIRDPHHIDEAIKLLSDPKLDTVASVKGPFKKRDPILKRLRQGILEAYCDHENPGKVEPFYVYNASIYGAKRDYLVRERKLISGKQIPLIMDPYYSIDIDTELDFLIAEVCLKHITYLEHEKIGGEVYGENETHRGSHTGTYNSTP